MHATLSRLGTLLFGVLSAISYFLILAPLVLVVWISFTRDAIITLPPSGYTLDWYAKAYGNQEFIDGLWLSVRVALAAAAGGLVLGTAAATAIVRHRLRGAQLINNILLSPLIVPNIVLGLAIYLLYLKAENLLDFDIVGTPASLVVAHLCLTLPWTVRLVAASLHTVDPAIEDAARNLGAGRFTVFRRITLPLLRPAIVSAALFSFIVSFENLEISLPLIGAGHITLPIAIMQYLEYHFDPTIAAVSTVQIALLGIVMLVTNRIVRLGRVL